MQPLTEIERTLREAMSVEPGGDFTARIRARVAESPWSWRARTSPFALATTCAVLAIVASTWGGRQHSVTNPVLPHRDLLVVIQPPSVVSSPARQQRLRIPRATPAPTQVLVARSEMLALQRLFSGIVVAPPPPPPAAEQLSIPELAIAPLVTGNPEGERQ
jgi:hypothetical protein